MYLYNFIYIDRITWRCPWSMLPSLSAGFANGSKSLECDPWGSNTKSWQDVSEQGLPGLLGYPLWGPSSLAKLVTRGDLGISRVYGCCIDRSTGWKTLRSMTSRRPRLWKWMTIQWKLGGDRPAIRWGHWMAGKGNSPDSGYSPMSSNMAGKPSINGCFNGPMGKALN